MLITEPLANCITTASDGHSSGYFHEIRAQQFPRKKDIQQVKQSYYSSVSCNLCAQLNHSLQLALDLATAKGGSPPFPYLIMGSPFTSQPFMMQWLCVMVGLLSQTPSRCACRNNFSIEHALSCPKGGLPSLCCNEIRDLTANLLTEVCHQVQVEPEFQPVSVPESFPLSTANIQDRARLDIPMNRFWGGQFECCYGDVRVFNPYPPSNANSISSVYRHHENINVMHMANEFVR